MQRFEIFLGKNLSKFSIIHKNFQYFISTRLDYLFKLEINGRTNIFFIMFKRMFMWDLKEENIIQSLMNEIKFSAPHLREIKLFRNRGYKKSKVSDILLFFLE